MVRTTPARFAWRKRLRSARKDPILRWWAAYLVVWCAVAVLWPPLPAIAVFVGSYCVLLAVVWFTRVRRRGRVTSGRPGGDDVGRTA